MSDDDEAAAIGRELRRWRISLRDGGMYVLTPESWAALMGVFRPERAAVRDRLAKTMPSESELIAWWLAEVPGAEELQALHGRASLVVLARQHRLAALDAGEKAIAEGATWPAAEQVADRVLRKVD